MRRDCWSGVCCRMILKVLCWRDVPVRTECLGEMALSTMPKIRQVLVVDSERRRAGDDGAAALSGAQAV